MLKWDRIERLFGETVREIGILVVVFAPLEAAFADRPIAPWAVTGAIMAGVGLIVVGIILETRE